MGSIHSKRMFWFTEKYAFFMVKVINLKTYGWPLGIKTASGERFAAGFAAGSCHHRGLPGVVTLPAPSVQHDQPQVTHFRQKSECPHPAAGKREQNCQLIIIQEQSRPFILAGREPLSPQDTCSRVQ